VLNGAAGYDTLLGGLGSDTLNGGDGNDILDGGAAADVMTGGLGDDTYYVDAPSDRVAEGSAAGGTDLVISSISYSLMNKGYVENLTLNGTSAINATGNYLANVLTGNSGANLLIGGFGDDTYIVNRFNDAVTEGAAAGGIDLVLSSVTYSLVGRGYVENLTLTGANAINGAGNSHNNVLTGNNAANQLQGAAGNDVLYGEGGDDTLFGQYADDVLFGGAGEDLLYGHHGADVLKGGEGADLLDGGAGADRFVFDASLGAGNVDTIVGFAPIHDTIELDIDVFTEVNSGVLDADAFIIGSSAADGEDRIIYDSATGALYYDEDGLGGAAQIQFATLSPGLALTQNDLFGVG
jgi:serralysin